MIHKSVEVFLPEVKALLIKHKVINAYFFGSVVTDQFNSKSDIDLMITYLDYSKPLEVGQSIWDLEDELEMLTSRKIDLLTELSLKNPYLI